MVMPEPVSASPPLVQLKLDGLPLTSSEPTDNVPPLRFTLLSTNGSVLFQTLRTPLTVSDPLETFSVPIAPAAVSVPPTYAAPAVTAPPLTFSVLEVI